MGERISSDFRKLEEAIFLGLPAPIRAYSPHHFLALFDINFSDHCLWHWCQTRLVSIVFIDRFRLIGFNLNFLGVFGLLQDVGLF